MAESAILVSLLLLLCSAVCSENVSDSRDDLRDTIDVLVQQVSASSDDDIPIIYQSKLLVNQGADDLKNEIGQLDDPDALSTINDVLWSAQTALDKFQSDDPKVIISGALDMISAFAPLLGNVMGPQGTAIGLAITSIARLASGILGLFGGGHTPVADVVRYAIDDALKEERNRRLENHAYATQSVFRASQAFLNGVRGRNGSLETHEVAGLSAHVPVYLGVEFMGELAAEIRRVCVQDDVRNSELSALSETCLRYTNLYAELSTLQNELLLDLYSLIAQTGHSDNIAAGVIRVMRSRARDDKQILEFLHEPTSASVVPVSMYMSAETPVLDKFLDYCGVVPAEDLAWLGEGSYSLHPERWPDWRMYLKDSHVMGSSKPRGASTCMRFENVEGNFWQISAKRDSGASDALVPVGLDGKKYLRANAANCKFVFIKPTDSDKYLILNKDYPDYSLYMRWTWWGTVKATQGDPGTQGYWTIKPC